MRFIVDRCAGKRIAEWLRERGHDGAVAWDEEPDPGDAELLARAAREDRVLVTMDKDFGEHVFVKGSPHCAACATTGCARCAAGGIDGGRAEGPRARSR